VHEAIAGEVEGIDLDLGFLFGLDKADDSRDAPPGGRCFSMSVLRMSTRGWITGIMVSSLWMVAAVVACSASFCAC
jgi:hypothetical protein